MQMKEVSTIGQQKATFNSKTSHSGANVLLRPILPVHSLAKYRKKENSTHAHSEIALCGENENKAHKLKSILGNMNYM